MPAPAILDAARFARLPELRKLLRQGADPNVRNRGYRPLHSLIQEPPGDGGPDMRTRLACLDLLLEHGADPDALAAHPPARALLVAAFTGEPAFVERLERASARRDVFTDAALGETASLKRRLGRDAGLARARDEGGLTALQCAAGSRLAHRDAATARRLLAAAAALLDAGADANALTRSWSGDVDVASFAANAGHRAMLALLLERGADPTAALSSALWTGGEELAQLTLDRGAVPDRATSGGRPLLNELVRWGRIGPALWLLERGASPDLADERGFTAVHQAASRGNARVLEALLAAGGDTAREDAEGRTPRDVARQMGRKAMLAKLGEQPGRGRSRRGESTG